MNPNSLLTNLLEQVVPARNLILFQVTANWILLSNRAKKKLIQSILILIVRHWFVITKCLKICGGFKR